MMRSPRGWATTARWKTDRHGSGHRVPLEAQRRLYREVPEGKRLLDTPLTAHGACGGSKDALRPIPPGSSTEEGTGAEPGGSDSVGRTGARAPRGRKAEPGGELARKTARVPRQLRGAIHGRKADVYGRDAATH